ncbi:MAG: phasin family protein [Methyloceanibacter sp.]
MAKQSSSRADTRKTRHPHHKTASKVTAEKVGGADRTTALKIGAVNARQKTSRNRDSKVAAEKAQDLHGKTAAKVTPQRARAKVHKVGSQVDSETALSARKSASKVAAKKARDTDRRSDSIFADKAEETYRQVTNQFDQIRATVPDSMRALAERNIAQTRELHERSANALKAALESWADSLDEVGQEAVALNRKILDIAARNVSNSFDLVTNLVRAKNVAETMEVQAAHWRKQFGELRMQAEEVRALLQKAAVRAVERSRRS